MAETTETRKTTAIAIPVDLVEKLRTIAAIENKFIVDLVEPLIRPWVEKELRKVKAKLIREANGEAGA